MIENFKTVAEGLHSSASVAALVVGGYWAYHRFIKQNENFPRIKFEVDLNFVGEVQDCWLVDVIAHIDNKGLVPIQIPKMHFALFGLSETDPLDESDESLSRNLKFPHAIKKADWHNWTSTFIEPGVSTRYTHIAIVPKKYRTHTVTLG